MRDVVILAARRTPLGSFQGCLSGVPAPVLAGISIKAALADSGVEPDRVDQVLLGCVLPAGLGQAPARQAASAADLPVSVPCTGISKVCGSGMQAVMIAADMIRAGTAERVVAGGMESMSGAPYLLTRARAGYRLGHGETLDHMLFDGLQNAGDGTLMGVFAERTAEQYGFTRAAQDEFATESVRRALDAIEQGRFKEEIVPVTVTGRHSTEVVERDEEPFRCDIEKIPRLKPAFSPDGTITAASSSSISDAAAALVLAAESEANARSARPLARLLAAQTHAQTPETFTTANIGAISKLQARLGWTNDDVDLYEINEAFACVTMATMKELGIPHAKVNVNGGACALGHPIGATGARILVTLIHALRARRGRRGIAALCIGGGESTAVAVEAAS